MSSATRDGLPRFNYWLFAVSTRTVIASAFSVLTCAPFAVFERRLTDSKFEQRDAAWRSAHRAITVERVSIFVVREDKDGFDAEASRRVAYTVEQTSTDSAAPVLG